MTPDHAGNVVGVDPHKRTLTETVADARGGILASAHFRVSGEGHRELEAWARQFGPIARWGIEGSASWGRHTAVFLAGRGHDVRDVCANRTPRSDRARQRGKSDMLDSERIAREVLAHPLLPKAFKRAGQEQGPDEQHQLLALWHNRRRSILTSRQHLVNEAEYLLCELPLELSEQLPDTKAVKPRLAALERRDRRRRYDPPTKLRLQLLDGYRTQIKALDLEEKQVVAQLEELVDRSGSTLGELSGLSTRSVAELLVEVGDARRFTEGVSRVCAELSERFEAFCRRSLHDVKLVVLFLDAIYLPVRPSGPKEGVICAWGITENGDRELVSVRLGMRETKEDWPWLGRDLTNRGLPAPRLVVADGAAGLPSAVEEIWPRADRQHCAVHRLRNLLAKLPKSEQDRIRFHYWSALTDATSVKDGKLRLQVLISELEHGGYESAARCLGDDLDALVVHLRYPLRHRERWRSTNLLERSLGEVRRRTKVMGRFPGEPSCLSLVWAVLDLFFSHVSNGATFTDVDRQHLYRIKYRQADPDTLDEEVTAA